MDYAATPPALVDYGRITDQDGRKPVRLESLAADANGNVYLTGDWQTKPGDKPTIRQGKEIERCQRFAFVRLPGEARP